MSKKAMVTKEILVNSVIAYYPNYETMTISKAEATAYGEVDLAKLAVKLGAVKVEITDSTRTVYGVDVDTFRRISKVLTDDDSRRNLVTRTFKVAEYTLFDIDLESMTIKSRTVLADSRLTEKEVLAKYGASKCKRTGSQESLYGCTVEAFMKNAEPVKR